MVPCMHALYCLECAKSLIDAHKDKCPICKRKIIKPIEINFEGYDLSNKYNVDESNFNFHISEFFQRI